MLKVFAVLLFFIFPVSCKENTKSNETKKSGTLLVDNTQQRPAWIDEIPLVVAGGWDSEPATQRRWNDVTVDYLEDYRKQNSEETVLKMKEMGITLVINHYFKGYGLEGEGEYMEDARKFAELCHKHGIKAGAYFGDTFCYEQFLLENPNAMDWIVPDYLGQPVRYGGTQSFRMRPYIGHPDYMKYIKKVLYKAIVDAKIDFIHFDNSCSYGLPQNFHHPLAIEQFRYFLRNKYTPEQLDDRFDFTDVKYVIPPKISSTPQPIQDPLFQEWTDFRCQKVGEYLTEIRRYIKELNPEVVVESNPHGVTGDNTAWTRGVDWPRILAPTEVFWCEGEGEPGLKEDGTLGSRIRTYKVARTMNNKSLIQLGHSKLMMAETMAYNQNCLGYIGARLSVFYWDDDARRNVKYFHDNYQYYKKTQTIPEVAVLRTFPTMAYGTYNTQYSTIMFEQTLIQTKIPFDIIFDQHLDGISKYKVLVLADQECMTDEQIDKVRKYVENGGGLVITGKSSLYNDWRRRRHSLGLRDLFKEDLPYPPATKVNQNPWAIDSKWYRHTSLISDLEGFTDEKKDKVTGEFGEGRVVYIPYIKPGINKPAGAPPVSNYWGLPENFNDLKDAVVWSAGGSLSIEIDAPLYVTMERLIQPEQNRTLIHLVNYDLQNNPLVKDIKIRMVQPDGIVIKEIKLLSPDSGTESKLLDYKVKDGWIRFVVPGLQLYDLIAIQY
jgi:hypothetical protein